MPAAGPQLQYTNPSTGNQTMSVPQTYGTQTSPLTNFAQMTGIGEGQLSAGMSNYLLNPGAYLANQLHSLMGASNPALTGQLAPNNMGNVNSILQGLGLNINPTMPNAPTWQSTPNLQQMAAQQGTPLTLNDTVNANGGTQAQLLDPANQIANYMLGNWLPQYAQAAFKTNLGGGGAASGVPGESAMGGDGAGGASVFGAKTLANTILPAVLNVKQQALAPYMQSMQNLNQANVGNAGWMSQQDNQFSNQMNYEQYIHAAQLAMQQQQLAASLAQQRLGAENTMNIDYQNGLLSQQNALQNSIMSGINGGIGGLTNATISAAYNPNGTMQSGPMMPGGGGTNYVGSGSSGGSSGGGGGGGGIDMNTFTKQALDWFNNNANRTNTGNKYDPNNPTPGSPSQDGSSNVGPTYTPYTPYTPDNIDPNRGWY